MPAATHNRVHTGEKPLECGNCTYTCSDPSNMAKHRKGKGHPSLPSAFLLTNNYSPRASLVFLPYMWQAILPSRLKGSPHAFTPYWDCRTQACTWRGFLRPRFLIELTNRNETRLILRGNDAWRSRKDIPRVDVVFRCKVFTFTFLILYTSHFL